MMQRSYCLGCVDHKRSQLTDAKSQNSPAGLRRKRASLRTAWWKGVVTLANAKPGDGSAGLWSQRMQGDAADDASSGQRVFVNL